jgi:hypothetical protein
MASKGVHSGHSVESFSMFCGTVALYASSWQEASGSCVGSNSIKGGSGAREQQRSSVRSVSVGKRLDPALKSWLDNVIIPALVREYVAEVEKHNRFAMAGGSELPSD